MDRVPRLADDGGFAEPEGRGQGQEAKRLRHRGRASTERSGSAEPEDRRRGWRAARPGRVGILLAAVVALGLLAGLGVWFISRPTGPEAVVRDYLNAVHRRDPDRALRIAGASRPTGERGALLTADAIDSRWAVGRVITGRPRTEGGLEKVDVQYSLRYSGGGLGEGIKPGDEMVIDDGVTLSTFRLSREAGRWRIENALVELAFANSPLWYIEVNKVKIPLTGWKPDRAGRRFFPVFPGRYLLYPGESHYVRIEPHEIYVIPGENSSPLPVGVSMTAGLTLFKMFQKAAEDLLAGCVADSNRGAIGGCLLRPESGGNRTPEGVLSRSGLRGAHWKLVRVPTMALTQDHTVALDNGLLAYSGQVHQPGELRLAAKVRGSDGKPVMSIRTCLVERIPLVAAIDSNGDPSIRWRRPAGTGARPSADRELGVRCRD